MLKARVIGAEEAEALLAAVAGNMDELAPHVMEQMASNMQQAVHVQSGYLKSTIRHDGPYAYVDAPYAGFEAERGGDHDFPAIAEEHINWDEVADWLVGE